MLVKGSFRYTASASGLHIRPQFVEFYAEPRTDGRIPPGPGCLDTGIHARAAVDAPKAQRACSACTQSMYRSPSGGTHRKHHPRIFSVDPPPVAHR